MGLSTAHAPGLRPRGSGQSLLHDGDLAGDGEERDGGGFDICQVAPPSLVVPQSPIPRGESIRVIV